MEYRAFASENPSIRKDSNISADLHIDLSDTEHCILCFNNMYFIALGKCDHRNVCHTCALRLRFIIKDFNCPICKTELKEIFICSDKTMTFDRFLKDYKGNVLVDKDDDTVFYENNSVKS